MRIAFGLSLKLTQPTWWQFFAPRTRKTIFLPLSFLPFLSHVERITLILCSFKYYTTKLTNSAIFHVLISFLDLCYFALCAISCVMRCQCFCLDASFSDLDWIFKMKPYIQSKIKKNKRLFKKWNNIYTTKNMVMFVLFFSGTDHVWWYQNDFGAGRQRSVHLVLFQHRLKTIEQLYKLSYINLYSAESIRRRQSL